MIPIHPGRILKRELGARNLCPTSLSTALRLPAEKISAILNHKHSITPEIALRLARFFGTTPEFWLTLQARHDLAITERELGAIINAEVQREG